MRKLSILAAALALSACSGTTPATQWTNGITAAGVAWPVAEIGISADLSANKATPATVAAVTKAEAVVTLELSTLAASPAPVSTATAIADARAVIAALPPNVLSTAHGDEIEALISALQLLAGATTT